MKPIFAIDPGTTWSAYVEYDPGQPKSPIVRHGHIPNVALLRHFHAWADWETTGVIEVMHYYGPRTKAGADVFTTCEWIGQFTNEWHGCSGHQLQRLTKPQVNHHLCNKQNAEKSEIRCVMYQRFGDGSRRSAMGIKKAPGPLYGLVGDHIWDALALAVTWDELNQATTERDRR